MMLGVVTCSQSIVQVYTGVLSTNQQLHVQDIQQPCLCSLKHCLAV